MGGLGNYLVWGGPSAEQVQKWVPGAGQAGGVT